MQGTSVRAVSCASCTVEVYRSNRAPGSHGPGITFLASAVAGSDGAALFAEPPGGWGTAITATTRTVKGSTSEFATNIAPTGGGGSAVTVNSAAPNVLGQDASWREIKVNGSGFGAGTTVSLGAGVTVNSLAVTSPTLLTLKVSVAPAAAVGPRDVVVTTPAGTGTCSGCFNVAVAPTVSGATPNAWNRPSSGVLEIAGANFTGSVAVSVSGSGVTVGTVTRVSSTLVRANLTVAANAELGQRTVTLRNGDAGRGYTAITIGSGDGGGGGVSAGSAVPNVLGQDASWREVKINGSGFTTGTTVALGAGVTVNSTTVTSPTLLTLKVSVAPSAAVGPRDVVVSAPGGSGTCAGCFNVAVAPTVSAISPATLARGTTSTVEISGADFSGSMAVSVSGTGVTAGPVTRLSDTLLRVDLTTAPDAPTGPRTVTVRNGNAGRGYTTLTIA
jgi:hypothetical protein